MKEEAWCSAPTSRRIFTIFTYKALISAHFLLILITADMFSRSKENFRFSLVNSKKNGLDLPAITFFVSSIVVAENEYSNNS